jgi:hypothetical protein
MIRPTRRRLGRTLRLGGLTLAVSASALLGTQLQSHPTADASAVEVARTQHAATRGYTRTAPTPTAAPTSAAPSASPTPTRTATRKPAKPAPPPVPAACRQYRGNQLIACKLLPQFGFSYSQMPSLVNLWNGESNWNTSATNPDSGAYGIPQALPAEKLGTAGANWRTSAETQIRWGLGYIKASYGTPDNAWWTWSSRYPHWY